MKTYVFDANTLPKEILKNKLKLNNAILVNKPLNEKNALKYKDAEIVCARINSNISKKVLDKMPKLKLINFMTTGYDNVELQECNKRKIKVANVPNYSSEGVAEQAIALLFSISRKIILANNQIKTCKIDMPSLNGFELKGKTIGIIGTGDIGLHMAKLCKGINMNVLAFDINKNLEKSKSIGFKYVNINNLLNKSDIISLHIPLNKYTKHFLSKKEFSLMKKGVVIINTARGEIINSKELLKNLNSERVAFAGLDVFEKEEIGCVKKVSINNKLINHKNVIATPHSAFNTREAIEKLIDISLKNIKDFKKGKLSNVVN
jgi:D-lactate dehydrogenase